jgi:hypothetical protein
MSPIPLVPPVTNATLPSTENSFDTTVDDILSDDVICFKTAQEDREKKADGDKRNAKYEEASMLEI